MPVHFAAARSANRSPVARALTRGTRPQAQNDNGEVAPLRSSIDATMRAALRHFAEHGLDAANEARRRAEQAHFTGDSESCAWWTQVCRTLDRRVARALDDAIAPQSRLIY